MTFYKRGYSDTVTVLSLRLADEAKAMLFQTEISK